MSTEQNFKFIVEYDGTDFYGWQKQPGLRTVQGTLEDALSAHAGDVVQVHGAGRTDAGVHALGQVCSFTLHTHLTAYQVGKAIASNLPDDVQIHSAEIMDAGFHARFSAKSRRYDYYVRTEPTAIWRRFAHVVTYPLDIPSMQKALTILEGEHDFTSFTQTKSADLPTDCHVTEASVRQVDDVITVTVIANRFLRSMVRIIVGTVLEVGRGKLAPEQVEEILCTKDRNHIGPTAPPNGLFLTEVRYHI